MNSISLVPYMYLFYTVCTYFTFMVYNRYNIVYSIYIYLYIVNIYIYNIDIESIYYFLLYPGTFICRQVCVYINNSTYLCIGTYDMHTHVNLHVEPFLRIFPSLNCFCFGESFAPPRNNVLLSFLLPGGTGVRPLLPRPDTVGANE